MRTTLASLAVISLAAFGAVSAMGAPSGGSSIKIAIPPAGQAKVSKVVVRSSGPLKIGLANAAQLRTPQVNTQIVTVASAKRAGKSTIYTIYVIIHRWPSARRVAGAAGAARSGGEDLFAEILFGAKAYVEHEVDTLDCSLLRSVGIYYDPIASGSTFDNLIKENSTAIEEQIDVAVHTKCPDAEADDPGGS